MQLYLEKKAKLVLVAGTSLSGMNADRVVSTACEKRRIGSDSLGAVIVNLQKTRSSSAYLGLKTLGPGFIPGALTKFGRWTSTE